MGEKETFMSEEKGEPALRTDLVQVTQTRGPLYSGASGEEKK